MRVRPIHDNPDFPNPRGGVTAEPRDRRVTGPSE
jgi:hypothetical protein